jgi:hypothetical protein
MPWGNEGSRKEGGEREGAVSVVDRTQGGPRGRDNGGESSEEHGGSSWVKA